MESRGRAVPGGTATSPESAMASELFDHFVSAGTFKSVLATYRQLCELLRLKPTNITNFYPRLKAKLHSWRAASLWAKLDKRASHKCYNRGKTCPNTRVLIIGAGPCGVRAAIEAQLLGAKVVVVEKRDRFSRNNVLHLWPFVIHDLRNLGAKKFFGKFCAGSIDHISIRQLQLILLKVALLLGVEVHENVGFESLIEPSEDQTHERNGWHARVFPPDHPVSLYEFDVLIGADGKRNTLLGFNRKEFRGKLAIAVTANFINRHTIEEARVPEISGVAFIFNQKFFQDMREQTAIDLENIVYYKDDTHYFVMTAKKQSLLERGVIIRDFNDTARLLAAENVDREALMEYARDAADFATGYQLPSLDFAVNHYGQADVAMFDFTSMYAAENACRVVERRGHKLLQGLVGDSLLEPFWPTGSGCGRGFLSSFDAAWMIRSWSSGKFTTLQVLAEREAIYRLLAQTTPENLSKDLNQYTLNPASRYPNLNLQAVLPSQVRSLYVTDGKVEESIVDIAVEAPKKKRRRESMIHPDTLLNWCQKQVALNDKIKIQDFTSSWKNGLALCAVLHHYRPDLIDINALDPENIAKNNQLAFDICEKELGIPPVMTGQEMAECAVPDKLTMVSYISQVYESFRGEIPVVCHRKCNAGEERTKSPNKQLYSTPVSILNKIGGKLQNRRKYSVEKELHRERGENIKRRSSSLLAHKRKSKERSLEIQNKDVILTDYKTIPVNKPRESINTRVKNLEEKMKRDAGLRCHNAEESESLKAARIRSEQTELNIKMLQEQLQKNGDETLKKSRMPKVGKLRKDEWNVKVIEEKTKQQLATHVKNVKPEKPKIFKELFEKKLHQMDEKLKAGGSLTPEEEARYKKFDASLNKLKNRLSKGNLDVGDRGHNQTSALTEHMTKIWDKKVGRKKDPLPPAPVVKCVVDSDSSSIAAGSEICYFCQKRVYLMERLSTEGLFFHRSCFKCEYCSASLRIGNHSFDRNAVCGGKFYCIPHFRMQKPDHRWQEMMKRKQAFLSCALEEQEKEKLYKTLLDNTEKALSPRPQSVENVNTSVPDSPLNMSEKKNDSQTPSNLLTEPSNIFGRDQTPERVEYENSIIELSEEELLTSELEEEELTQKNLGPSQDLATSEDEYSDLSTDTESDEEAFAEELERSLTADETRKLAETWTRKYSTEPSLIDSVSSSSADDEGSETEIGSDDTSDDIDSDVEYSVENSEEDVIHVQKDDESPAELKSPEIGNEFTVEVPIIDLKSINKVSEDEITSDSELTDTDEDSEGETETEVDSESEPKVLLTPSQIPTIVIYESPPQDIDLDQEWDVNISNKVEEEPQLDDSVVILSNVSAVNYNADEIDLTAEKSSDFEQLGASAADEIYADIDNKKLDGKLMQLTDKNFNLPSSKMETKLSVEYGEPLKSAVKCIAPLAMEESSSDLSVSSGINSLAIEIVSGVLEAAKVFIAGRQVVSTPDTDSCFSDSAQYSEKTSSTSDKWVILTSTPSSEEAKVQLIDLSSPVLPKDEIVTNLKLAPERTVPVIDLCSPSQNSKENSKLITVPFEGPKEESEVPQKKIMQPVDAFPFKPQDNETKCSTSMPLSDLSFNENNHITKLCQEKEDHSMKEIKPNAVSDLDVSMEDIKEISLCNEYLHDSFEYSKLDSSNVTVRKQKESNENNLFNWESDNSVSLPWCYEGERFSADTTEINENESIYHADVAQTQEVVSADENIQKVTCAQINNELDGNFLVKQSVDIEVPFTMTKNIDSFSNTSDCILLDNSYHEPSSNISALMENANVPNSMELQSITYKHLVDTESDNEINTDKTCNFNKNSVELVTDVNKSSDKAKSDTVISYSENYVKEQPLKAESRENSKYKGYSGSFAEKVRPKSLFCDTIYLRSLDINLQKQPFSSLNKSDDKLDECSKIEYEDVIKKKLFASSNEDIPLDSNNDSVVATVIKSSEVCESSVCNANVSPSCLRNNEVPSENNDKLGNVEINKIKTSGHKHSSVSFSAPESCSDLVSPYTYALTETCHFPTKVRPKCDMDVSKLRQKREKRKSVHEDIQGLPFADEDKLLSPVEQPSSCDVFLTPKSVSEHDVKFNVSSNLDNAMSHGWKTPDLIDEERYLRLQTSVEQEKARQEARARARLKSDEELGLSPNNYRKKYRRQLSLNSINYDELCSDEFCDQDDELEEEVISNFCQTKSSGIEETFSMLKNKNLYSKGRTDECFDSSSHHPINSVADSPSCNGLSPFASTSQVVSTSSNPVDLLDATNCNVQMDMSKNMQVMQTSKHSSKTSSSETSPDIFVSETPPFEAKFQTKVKGKRCHSEGSWDDDKCKSTSKKSIFSILNFGKSNMSKEKLKPKSNDSEKDISISLPNDIGVRSVPKTKPFSHLKLTKSKEKSIKPKAKSEPQEDVLPAQEDPQSVSFNAHTRIIPKYAVYRNPETTISTFPVHLPLPKIENGLAPKASEDSFSDEDETQGSKAGHIPNIEKSDKNTNEKEKKAQRIVQKVQRLQVLKRLRNAQEIQRRLEELEIQQNKLEQQGVIVEKMMRGEGHGVIGSKSEAELMQDWYTLVHSKNKLVREEQELLIRLKDLELEDRHSRLQQEIRERMAQNDAKSASQIIEERKILAEMLEIVEKRGELVAMQEQLKLREEEEKGINSDIFRKGAMSLSPGDTS